MNISPSFKGTFNIPLYLQTDIFRAGEAANYTGLKTRFLMKDTKRDVLTIVSNNSRQIDKDFENECRAEGITLNIKA